MRMSVVSPALLAALAILAPVGARANDATGTILVATGTPVSDGNSRPARCAYGADPQSGQGVFGWVIEGVTPDASFSVAATSPLTDVDIDFFRKLTPCDADPDKASPLYDNQTGNERGTVPSNATVAIITLRNGPPGAGFIYHEG